ncbi:MAG: hypothetical protein WBD86_00515 [Microgenomates group bacterium]
MNGKVLDLKTGRTKDYLAKIGELLRATMRKNEKSIGLNKRKLTARWPSYILLTKNTI